MSSRGQKNKKTLKNCRSSRIVASYYRIFLPIEHFIFIYTYIYLKKGRHTHERCDFGKLKTIEYIMQCFKKLKFATAILLYSRDKISYNYRKMEGYNNCTKGE